MASVPTGIPTGVGSLFSKEVVQAVPAAGNYVVPPGWYYEYSVGANTKRQIIDSTGTWHDLEAVSVASASPFYSDGASIRYNNAAGAPQNVTLIQITP